MDSPAIDRAQLRALKALRRVFGHDQVHIIGVHREPPGTTTPPRNPPPRPKER